MTKIYPNERKQMPADVKRLIPYLRTKFNLDQPFPENEWITSVGWITNESLTEENYWRSSMKPCSKFFVSLNPHYREGYGLITIIRIDLLGILMTPKNKLKKIFIPKLYRIANLSPWLLMYLYGKKIKSHLESLDIFDKSQIDTLIKDTYPLFVPRNTILFQQGDISDGMYFLISGNVYVSIKNEKNTIVIDQIFENNLIGEIGSLAKVPRTASIRTISDCIFIKLDQRHINQLLPQLRLNQEKTFKLVGIRLLENYINVINPSASWLKLGDAKDIDDINVLHLPKGHNYQFSNPIKYLFLYTGLIKKITSNDEISFLGGQSLIKSSKGDSFLAIEDSYLLMIEPVIIERYLIHANTSFDE